MRAFTALNGLLPDAQLVVVDTGPNGPQRLRADAAASWARMLAAGMPPGHLRSGYRTREQQAAEVDAAAHGQTPSAAPVGQSWHGEGLAADEDEPGRAWFRTNGPAHGWRFPIALELWHGEYHPDFDTHAQEDDDMFTDQDRDRLNAIWDAALGGQAGVKTQGAIPAALGRIEAAARTAADAVTPGQAGVKTAGPTFAAAMSAAAGTAQLLAQASADLDPTDLAHAIAAAIPEDIAEQVVTLLGEKLTTKETK